MLIFNQLSSYRFRWEPSGGALPMSCEIKGSAFAGVVWIVVGAGIGIMSLPLFFSLQGGPGPYLFLASFPVVGLLLIYLGIMEIMTRKHYTIGPSYVEFRQTGFLPKSWKLPRTHYRAVARGSKHYTSKYGGGHTVYYVALKHASDKKKDLPLYISGSREKLDQEWRHFSALFDLPPVDAM